MMKITVCDDCLSDLLRTKRLLEQYKEECAAAEFEVEGYSDSVQLYHKIEEGDYADIYILDVMMEHMNGIELGGFLRRVKPGAVIIYTTASRDYAVEAYQVLAQRYLVKPYAWEEFREAVDYAVATAESGEKSVFYIKTKEGVTSVNCTKILYVECAARTLHVHLTDGRVLQSIFIRRSFEQETAILLADHKFQQVHKSFIINMAHVEVFTQERITMSDGMKIPVSQKRAAQVKQIYFNYISDRYQRGIRE